MAGLDVAIPVTGHFDFNLLKSTPEDAEKGTIELVDVGGGYGACLQQITDAYPALDKTKCVLQDRKDVIETAKANAPISIQGLQFLEHDFRTEQPVKGQLLRGYSLNMVFVFGN